MTEPKHTAEFESCVQQVMKQGHDKGSAFAICTDAFKKAGKPIFTGESEKQKLHLFYESFKLEGNEVSGVAIHPRRIFHPEDGVTHVYLREELEKAAPTLIGKPFGIDHAYVLPPPNIVTKAWYCPEHKGICFEGIVDDQVAREIRRKAFKGLSIELNWLRPGGKVEYVNGVAARNFELTSVHFLKRFPPGDPDAYVKLWEQIKEQLVVGPPLPLDQRVEALETQVREVLNQVNVINAKLEVLTGSAQPTATVSHVPTSPLGLKNPSKTIRGEKLSQKIRFEERIWDRAYINDLPDAAFAIILPGGEKDESGKTTPRNLRKFPHHRADGSIDLPHLRNANARVPQSDLTEEQKAKAKAHLDRHKKAAGIGEFAEAKRKPFKHGWPVKKKIKEQNEQGVEVEKEVEEVQKVEFEVALEPTMDELIESIEDALERVNTSIDQMNENFAALDAKVKALEDWRKESPRYRVQQQEQGQIREQQGEGDQQDSDEYKQFMAQCLESGKTMEECAAAWRQKQGRGETETQGAQTESTVALRKKLVDIEAQLAKIEKQKTREAASWKEKYEKLCESVKGAVPPPRIWKSWTPGPQRYVQENLKILRQTESQSQRVTSHGSKPGRTS